MKRKPDAWLAAAKLFFPRPGPNWLRFFPVASTWHWLALKLRLSEIRSEHSDPLNEKMDDDQAKSCGTGIDDDRYDRVQH